MCGLSEVKFEEMTQVMPNLEGKGRLGTTLFVFIEKNESFCLLCGEAQWTSSANFCQGSLPASS